MLMRNAIDGSTDPLSMIKKIKVIQNSKISSDEKREKVKDLIKKMAPTLRGLRESFRRKKRVEETSKLDGNNFDYLRFVDHRHLNHVKNRSKTASARLQFNNSSIRRKSKKEYDLEQKIDLETKMRDGTNRLLAACRHPAQAVEASKNLLTSDQRMAAYAAELQRRKSKNADKLNTSAILSHSSSNTELSRAKVCVSDIRMPLIWKETDHFKNKGDFRRFAIFCLLKIGTEIYDTTLLNDVDRNLTDVSFPDVVVFNDVATDFQFNLEIYSHILDDDLSIASTPHKLKKRIANSVGRTVGKKIAASLKEDANYNIGPKFALVAKSSLVMSDLDVAVRTHDLSIQNVPDRRNQLPLFGHFCCRLVAQPYCMLREKKSGFLVVNQKVGNLCGRRRFWGRLKNFALNLLSKPEDESDFIQSIRVDDETKVVTCDRPKNSFVLSNPGERDVVLTAENETEAVEWTSDLRQHQRDFTTWGKASENLMPLPDPYPSNLPFLMRPRGGSLYDQTPLKDSPKSSSDSNLATGSSPELRSSSANRAAVSSSLANVFSQLN